MAGRIDSIDTVRILAMAFVIIIHTDPFEGLGATANGFNFVLESTARFAVPFFFVAAGYFFARKTAASDPTEYLRERLISIGSIYVFGLSFAVLVFLSNMAREAAMANRDVLAAVVDKGMEYVAPVELLYYGTAVSEILWFLPALAYSYVFIYFFVKLEKTTYLIPVALGIHVVGLLGQGYAAFGGIALETRDPLFFGFFYTALGYVIAASDWRPSPDRRVVYLGATVFFGVFHVVERYLLGYVLQGETFAEGVYAPSYTIGTILVTVSLFCLLLATPRLGSGTVLPAWGRKYAVGIYVVHPAVLFVLVQLRDELSLGGTPLGETILWHLVFTPATFFGAFLICLAISAVGDTSPRRIPLSIVRQIRNRISIT